MISETAWNVFFSMIKLIPFAPESGDLPALSIMLEEFVSSDEQLDWLGMRLVKLYRKFPAPAEIRACFCSKFKPKDGINAYSEVYANGIPSETNGRIAIAGHELKQLPPGHVVTTNKRADIALKIALAAQRHKDAAMNGRSTAEEIAAAPDWLRKLEGYE